jgi:hypothetical protein
MCLYKHNIAIFKYTITCKYNKRLLSILKIYKLKLNLGIFQEFIVFRFWNLTLCVVF